MRVSKTIQHFTSTYSCLNTFFITLNENNKNRGNGNKSGNDSCLIAEGSILSVWSVELNKSGYILSALKFQKKKQKKDDQNLK